jgi:hypothetical protein
MTTLFQWVYAPGNRGSSPTSGAGTSPTGITSRISQAFDAASDQTGTSFRYLVDTAQRESSLQADASASTSTAKGLFQFVEGTWLQTMKEAGPSLGLGQYADAITQDGRGHYSVSDPATRKAILDLRSDPEVASLIAGAYTQQNAGYLRETLGRDATAGELYIAHFLGPRGADQLIRASENAPDQAASALFPRQAAANPAIFYAGGKSLTVSEVYAELTSQHGNDVPTGSGDGRVMTAFATMAASPSHTVWDPALGYSDATAARRISEAEAAFDPIGSASPVASDASQTHVAATSGDSPEPAFSGLFRTDGTRDPTTSAAFWRGFGQAPAMFDVALAEDSKDFGTALTEASATSAALRASQSGQILDTSRQAPIGAPLDLAQFLKSS